MVHIITKIITVGMVLLFGAVFILSTYLILDVLVELSDIELLWFVFWPILLITLPSVIWTALPVKLYKKLFVRRSGYFFSVMMFLIFLISVNILLFSEDLFRAIRWWGGDLMGMSPKSFALLSAQSNIIAFLVLFPFIFFKIRKALKEIKEEEKPTSKISKGSYILITVILAVIIGGVFFAFQYWLVPRQEIPSSQIHEIKKPEKIEDETANWENYRNEKYGFEMKYPRDWRLTTDGEIIAFAPEAGKGERGVVIYPHFQGGPESIRRLPDVMNIPARKFSIFVYEERDLWIFFITTLEFKEESLPVFNQMLSTFWFLE